MRVVEDDDAGYLAWIDGRQHGFVVNTTRKPDPRYLRQDGKTARRRKGEFIKVCAESRVELDKWARQAAGGELHPCGLCRPE